MVNNGSVVCCSVWVSIQCCLSRPAKVSTPARCNFFGKSEAHQVNFLKQTNKHPTKTKRTHDSVSCLLWRVHMLLMKDVESKSQPSLEADPVQIPIVQILIEEISTLVAPAGLPDWFEWGCPCATEVAHNCQKHLMSSSEILFHRAGFL